MQQSFNANASHWISGEQRAGLNSHLAVNSCNFQQCMQKFGHLWQTLKLNKFLQSHIIYKGFGQLHYYVLVHCIGELSYPTSISKK